MSSLWRTGVAACAMFGLGVASSVLLRPADAGAAGDSPVVTVEGEQIRVTALPEEAYVLLGSFTGKPADAVGDVLLDTEGLEANVYRLVPVKRLEGRTIRWCNGWADCPIPPPWPPFQLVLAGKSTLEQQGIDQVPDDGPLPDRGLEPGVDPNGGRGIAAPSADLDLTPGRHDGNR